jgi:hypothetical protein
LAVHAQRRRCSGPNLQGNWAPWPDTEDAEAIAFIEPQEHDITVGYWLDLLLAQFQVLLDRRHEANSLLCEDGSKSRVTAPFIPTLLHYFGNALEPALKMPPPTRLGSKKK